MMRGDLDRGGRHQPDPLALVEVELGQRAGAGPDPVRHRLVEDLLAELLELGDGVAGDEAERGVAGVGDVLGVLDADDPEVGLLPGGAEDVAGGEELAPVQPAGQVEDAGALHDGVVDVEERRRRRVRRGVERGLDLGGGGRRLARQRRALLQVRRPAARVGGRGHIGSVDPVGQPPRARAPCGRIAVMPAKHDVADLVAEAAAERPDALAVVEAGGRSLTWAELEDEVGRIATGLGAAGVVAGHRVLIALRQPARVRHRLPRGAAGAGGRRTRQPAVDGRRAGPDDRRLRGRGWWSPTADGRRGPRGRRRRAQRARRRGDVLDPDLVARAVPRWSW